MLICSQQTFLLLSNNNLDNNKIFYYLPNSNKPITESKKREKRDVRESLCTFCTNVPFFLHFLAALRASIALSRLIGVSLLIPL